MSETKNLHERYRDLHRMVLGRTFVAFSFCILTLEKIGQCFAPPPDGSAPIHREQIERGKDSRLACTHVAVRPQPPVGLPIIRFNLPK